MSHKINLFFITFLTRNKIRVFFRLDISYGILLLANFDSYISLITLRQYMVRSLTHDVRVAYYKKLIQNKQYKHWISSVRASCLRRLVWRIQRIQNDASCATDLLKYHMFCHVVHLCISSRNTKQIKSFANLIGACNSASEITLRVQRI